MKGLAKRLKWTKTKQKNNRDYFSHVERTYIREAKREIKLFRESVSVMLKKREIEPNSSSEV